MKPSAGQKRRFRVLLLILLAAIILDKCWISRAFPETSGLVSINPMLVFLDIPVDMSWSFGALTVPGLFVLLYAVRLLPYHVLPHANAWLLLRRRLWRGFTAMLAIPCCTLSGGFLYFFAQDHLPKHARNAIESFGLNADIYTSFPGYERIRLRGSMIMLACFFIGMHICSRRIRTVSPDANLLSPRHAPETLLQEPAEFIAEPQPADYSPSTTS
jgi:hypothetical protein